MSLRYAASLAGGLLLALALGCTAELKLAGPTAPPEIPGTGFARAAFLASVNVATGRITITTPSVGTIPSGAEFSLVGGDAALLTTSNFSASAVGAFQPGKVRVSFDVAISNRLDNVDLIGPTSFPAPPPGTLGPLLFPYDIAVAVTSGGIGTPAQGNDVVIVLPSLGLVAPSPDWDGAPWSFFNDASCPGGDDCFPWEEFTPIGPGGTASARRVGFDIDPTVGQFTARLIVAADLSDLAIPATGSIQGTVSSPTLGLLAGVTLTASPGGVSAVSDGVGAFTMTGVPVGTVAVTLTGVPPLCTVQPSYLAAVTPGQITILNLVIACSPPPLLGSIVGTVQTSLGAAIPGALVTVTPTALPAELGVLTDGTGSFSVTAVDVSDGTGVIQLAGLPSGCADPGSIPYTGLVNGGVLTLAIVVVCP